MPKSSRFEMAAPSESDDQVASNASIRQAITAVRAGGASQTVAVRGMQVTICAKTKPMIEQDLPEPFPPMEAVGDPLAEWLR